MDSEIQKLQEIENLIASIKENTRIDLLQKLEPQFHQPIRLTTDIVFTEWKEFELQAIIEFLYSDDSFEVKNRIFTNLVEQLVERFKDKIPHQYYK